jgi:hypothetical protein
MTPADPVLPPDREIVPPFDFPTPDSIPLWLDHDERRARPPSRRTTRRRRIDGERRPGDIALYVSAGSVACARAEATLRALLPNFDHVSLQVIDVARHREAAERERILFTPTLVCRSANGEDIRVLGDLTNLTVLLDVLHSLRNEPT